MISIIAGPKGTGKTKAFIEKVNSAVTESKGNIVCVAKDNRLMFDLASEVRLIDTSSFDLSNYKVLYGFICGIISENFDISDIFIESLTGILKNIDEYDNLMGLIEDVSEKFNVSFTLFLSMEKGDVPEKMKQYLI